MRARNKKMILRVLILTLLKSYNEANLSSNFCLDAKVDKKSRLHLHRRSIILLSPKIKELAALKHLLFSRSFQAIDARLLGDMPGDDREKMKFLVVILNPRVE